MKKEEGFYFIPKKWLGDVDILSMDWDCRGMHLHLMAIAWQQKEQGHILDDDALLRKVLSNPDIVDWNNRIKPQIFSAWQKTNLTVDGVERAYWFHAGLLKNVSNLNIEQKAIKKPRKKKDSIIVENPEYDGFNLKSILNINLSTTILHEKSSEQDKDTIWKLGVQLISRQGESNMKARGLIAKLVKDYGEKSVAQAIAQLSLKNNPPAEAYSYLVWILKKQSEGEEIKQKGTGKGRVSI